MPAAQRYGQNPETPLSTLFPREIELLAVLAKGWTNLQIAATMGVGKHRQIRNLYNKIGLHNPAAADALSLPAWNAIFLILLDNVSASAISNLNWKAG
ncbi:LuxR C-terminal-related transcriptional regulator [Agrobacterium pusense]|uniref:LuxR C-terminal-related transcriptional regulator n=1 Tax=Agrobacterium pusense TaxID=648995 RepID=UPI002FDE0ED6